ncbi:MAG: branched-chain amino acid ABC transporter permease [Deltaproteobacteria bacterium]|nr:branched-chain amino acid ABC transporter permease [Deltaproteobacteria bacterium]
MRSPGRLVVLAVAVVVPLVLTEPYHIGVLVLAGLFVLLALGFDMVVGYLGELSLGHAAFFGIGAYTSAILNLTFDTPFLVDFLAAVVLSAVAGLLIGYPCLKLKGPYFAIVTFGFAEILQLVALNWVELTRGPMGLPGVKRASLEVPGLFSFRFESELSNYYLVLAAALACIFVTTRIIGSRVGNAFLAIRENDDLAASVGVNTFHYKMLAFVIGMTYAGIAGSLYAHYVGYVSPELLSFFYSYTVIIMVVVGGQGSIRGTVVGALIFALLPEILRGTQMYRMSIFGLLLVLSVIFMPEGINGVLERAGELLRRRRAVA